MPIIKTTTVADINTIMHFTSLIATHERAATTQLAKKAELTSYLFGNKPRVFCLLAEDNGTACGYITYTFEFSLFMVVEYIRVNSLFVHEDYRGKGVGKLLLSSVMNIAK